MTVGGFFKALHKRFTKKNNMRAFPSNIKKPIAFTNKAPEYKRYVPEYTAEQKKKRNAITFRLREIRKLVADKDDLEKKIDELKKGVLRSNVLTNNEKKGIEAGEFDLTGVYPNGKAPRRNTAASLAAANIATRLKGIKRNLSNVGKTVKHGVKEATKSNYARAKNLVENMGKKNITNDDFDKKKAEFYKLLGRRGPFGFRTIKRESEEELRRNFQKILNAREETKAALISSELNRAKKAANAAKEKRGEPRGALAKAAAEAFANASRNNKNTANNNTPNYGEYQELKNNNDESDTEEISVAAAKK